MPDASLIDPSLGRIGDLDIDADGANPTASMAERSAARIVDVLAADLRGIPVPRAGAIIVGYTAIHRLTSLSSPPVFRQLPPPTDNDVCDVVEGAVRRAHRSLVRRRIDPHDPRRIEAACEDLFESEPSLAQLSVAPGYAPRRLGPTSTPESG